MHYARDCSCVHGSQSNVEFRLCVCVQVRASEYLSASDVVSRPWTDSQVLYIQCMWVSQNKGWKHLELLQLSQ